MANSKDEITKVIEKVVATSKEPLETKEVFEKTQQSLSDVSRSKVTVGFFQKLLLSLKVL